ncbi:hypothetical protein X777_11936 [Ooceraea biroi]|uniref:Uncharacterized protein n=1 Tax=Ooceraea biroi TaxID=2015173 RepID=A0A026W060_OOCBI|nr:hypothetical protein X777_11936 [Ooceraea biroi]
MRSRFNPRRRSKEGVIVTDGARISIFVQIDCTGIGDKGFSLFLSFSFPLVPWDGRAIFRILA